MPSKFKPLVLERPTLKYLSAYSAQVQTQVMQMLEQKKLAQYLLTKYPNTHQISNDKALRTYVMTFKNQYLKKTAPLSQIKYDDKIHIINNALGLHSYVSRVQGNKLKSKHEIRIGSLFKKAPEDFLAMIVVHELAHLKEKEHNKAFYKLCQSMLPDYHQLELDLRIYLTHLDELASISAEQTHIISEQLI
ncbi:metal-dependent hydrolase [Colwellia sp. MT41]|uniref:M48 metallopeptidase family protein n=1 Tax=Colwellia TaxID=28228 RepID=UPI00070DAD4E|nr:MULTISPECIES: M48 family metallopeptidase [Colwellia]ALO34387.1 metal-dependent hydrolase [Colwellia sp. MT41]